MRQRPWLVLVGGFGGLMLLMAAAETGGAVVSKQLAPQWRRASGSLLSAQPHTRKDPGQHLSFGYLRA
jgi:hypothetical protein